MIVHNCFQNSDEWFDLRASVPTASEWDNLVKADWSPRTGDMPRTYLHRKIAEAWSGPQIAISSKQMEQGSMREDEALPWFEMKYDVDIRRVGFVTTDDGRLGCSPDGLIGETYGLEVKCPDAHTHIGYLMANTVPPCYLPQIHGSMLVTGLTHWKFVSYRTKFPTLVCVVERDEAIQAKLREVLDAFLAQMDAGIRKITDMANGELTTWRRKRLGL